MNSLLQDIYIHVIEGDSSQVVAKVKESLTSGLSASEILKDGLIAAMDQVGQLFEQGEFFVPEMLIAARAMQEGLAILKPHLAAADVQSRGKAMIGTVKGDLHDIGKNLVAMMLEGAGFEVTDLGVDVAPEKFLATVQEKQPHIVALSALLTTTMISMKTTIDMLRAAGSEVSVMVGGAPVTEAYAKQIGADGYAADASRAVSLARSLVAA